MTNFVEPLVRAGVSGVIGGVAFHFLLGKTGSGLVQTPLGTYKPSIAFGATIGVSHLLSEGIEKMVFDEQSKAEWNYKLYGLLSPAISSASSILVAKLMGFDISQPMNILKIGGVAFGSVYATDLLADRYYPKMMTLEDRKN